MCGIAGIVVPPGAAPVQAAALMRMAGSLAHRGPDGYGIAVGPEAGLVCTRLAMLDIDGAWQPMQGPSGATLAYTGEVYNYRELASAAGARAPAGDTEVLLGLLERHGLGALPLLNGQFAFALWSPADATLTLARDRFGVRPLYYAHRPDGALVFGSEVKAVLASGRVPPELDPRGIEEAAVMWAPRPPRTAFRGVRQLPPGAALVWRRGAMAVERWWHAPEPGDPSSDAAVEELLEDAVRIRRRADAPVGTFLSGGIDSALVTAMAREGDPALASFSLAFEDARVDEGPAARAVAAALGVRHRVVRVGARDVASAYERAVVHAEIPLVRLGPVAMMLLAGAARADGVRAVLTGEGADEVFWGYDLFKEARIRAFCRREPGSTARPRLFDRVYGDVDGARRAGAVWRDFFLTAGEPEDPLFSHGPRWRGRGLRGLLGAEAASEVAGWSPQQELLDELPPAFAERGLLERAAHLEMVTLLEPFLLAAQGDRMTMASGVEGRQPFLDHRLVAAAAALPAPRKMSGLRDKILLREIARRRLPRDLWRAPKRPFRGPSLVDVVRHDAGAGLLEALSPDAVADAGIFRPEAVSRLVALATGDLFAGERASMALGAVLSTQLLHRRFVAGHAPPPRPPGPPRVRLHLAPAGRPEVAEPVGA